MKVFFLLQEMTFVLQFSMSFLTVLNMSTLY